MLAAKSFETALKEIVKDMREELTSVESISSINFEIDVSGRVHDGDINIEFRIGSSYGTGGQVKGGSIAAVVSEYKRRFGWDKRNIPLCLPAINSISEEA
jgi:hypothetical protein